MGNVKDGAAPSHFDRKLIRLVQKIQNSFDVNTGLNERTIPFVIFKPVAAASVLIFPEIIEFNQVSIRFIFDAEPSIMVVVRQNFV